MDDMAGVSAALRETTEATSSESLGGFLVRQLQSSERAIQISAIETLHEYLFSSSSRDGTSPLERQTSILQDAALEFVPLLLQLLPQSPQQVKEILLLVSRISAPREVLFALEEAIKTLADRGERFEVSDNEPSDGGAQPEDDGPPIGELLDELLVVVDCLSEVIPRLPMKKSTPTLLTISNTLDDALSILTSDASPLIAAGLLASLSKLVSVCWTWSETTSDEGGEQRSLCSNLLYLSISTCGARMQPSSLQQWFLKMFPKYGKAKSTPESEAANEALTVATETYHGLGFSHNDLLTCLRQPQFHGLHAPVASLILLAHLILLGDLAQEGDSSITVESMRPMIVMALCDPGGAALQDAGLTVLWYICDRQQTIEGTSAEELLEVLMPITAGHRDSVCRLACFKLLGEIIQKCDSAEGKIKCLRLVCIISKLRDRAKTQLLDEANPYAQLRAEGLAILRDVILGLPDEEAGELLLKALEGIPALRRLPNMDTVSITEFLESIECLFITNLLQTLRYLLERFIVGHANLSARFGALDLDESLLRPVQAMIANAATSVGADGSVGGARGEEALHSLFAQERLEDEAGRFASALNALR